MATDHATCGERSGRLVALVMAIGIVSTGAVGCGPPVVRLVPAGGIVLIGGEPAADVSVQFLPDPLAGEVRPTSFAVTDWNDAVEARLVALVQQAIQPGAAQRE